jgi:uncharacterized protein YidB (DUF937 family)
MAIFDEIVSLSDQRFGLHEKARSLISLLLSMIVDPKTGGLGGFLDRLRKSGLNTVADRMLGGSDTAPLSKEQLEQALGGDQALHHLASKVGLSESTVASAAGFLLPKMIGILTPAGRVPDHLPGEVQEFIRIHEVGKVGAERKHEAVVATATARPSYEAPHRETHETTSPRDVVVEARDVIGETERREAYAAPRRETYEGQRRETYEAPRRESHEAPHREASAAPRRETYETQHRETYEAPRRETYEAPRREFVHEAPRRVYETAPDREDSSWFWWALPLVGLALLGAYATRAFAPAKEPRAYTPSIARREARPPQAFEAPSQPVPVPYDRREPIAETTAEPRETAVTPVTTVAPRLAIERLNDGRVRVSGVVEDDSTRRAVYTALETAFGSGKVVADIAVNPRAASANWLGRLVDIARVVAANPNAAIAIDGNKVSIGGAITDADRRSLVDAVKNYLGRNFTVD